MRVVPLLLLIIVASGIWIWGMARLASQRKWKLVGVSIMFPPLAVILPWRWGHRPRHAFYWIDGSLVAASLFFPLGFTIAVAIALVVLETLQLQRNGSGKQESTQKT